MKNQKTWTCCGVTLNTPSQDPDPDVRLARFAKALGHPARVAIMRLLIQRESCVCGELVDELPLAQSTVSQHLKKLKEAGLICGTIDGPRTCYCVVPGVLSEFKALMQAF